MDQFTQSLIDIVADLSRPLTATVRFELLVKAFKRAFPCNATALLRLEGQELKPLAIDGLNEEALGRCFALEDHPRLMDILRSRVPVRFPADSPLPDPYDGLIPEQGDTLHVHDCMGCSIYIDNEPWGVVTLDALDAGTFDRLNVDQLNAFVNLAEATVKAAQLIEQLEHQVVQGHQITQAVMADSQQEIIGRSKAVSDLKTEIATVAGSDLTVLIFGETGVGKELVARAIHGQSTRRDYPLVYVNCAALPENLVESELFGHVKGAFSGALQERSGKFELAHGGTLFLDEIGEIPLAVQPKLLRALQSGEIQRVGSDGNISVDVRIIAATNRNLHDEVLNNRFRADLYHRLSVYPINVPSLRERGKDILLLCGYFLERSARKMGLPKARLTPNADKALLGYTWPGNVRELEHCISRALLKAKQQVRPGAKPIISVDARHLDISDVGRSLELAEEGDRVLDSVESSESEGSLSEATDRFQRQLIQRALRTAGGNQAKAAKSLGMDRSNFYRLRKRLGLDPLISGKTEGL